MRLSCHYFSESLTLPWQSLSRHSPSRRRHWSGGCQRSSSWPEPSAPPHASPPPLQSATENRVHNLQRRKETQLEQRPGFAICNGEQGSQSATENRDTTGTENRVCNMGRRMVYNGVVITVLRMNGCLGVPDDTLLIIA